MVLGQISVRTKRTENEMETPDDVAVMLRLHEAGWGTKAIAEQLGCSRNTVRRYLRQGGWRRYGNGGRAKALDAHQAFVEQAFDQHRGNAEVVRQELVREHGVDVSLRTVERAVAERRRQRRSEVVATVRFETAPGQQLQADFGELVVSVGGTPRKVFLCVLTLGWSRCTFVQAFENERQANWLRCMEAAFAHFGGVPKEVLVDNARALVSKHDVETGEVVFAERFAQFAAHFGFKPRACAPYRARTKGKDERGVQYVKRNAIAGRSFASWEALSGWLAEWTRTVADVRIHGTTGERPVDRFEAKERASLSPLVRGPFVEERKLERRVHNDACVEVDCNWYTVPWPLVGAKVIVRVRDRRVDVVHAKRIVASHVRAEGRRERVVDDAHWDGLTRPRASSAVETAPPPPGEFERSLDVYAALVAAEEAA
jgi:transposase